MSKIRVRQHVNPLSDRYQAPIKIPDWSLIYADTTLPLHLDIGCARGRFLYQISQLQTQINFLGLEIREPLVDEANSWRDELGLKNLHYLFANANNSLGEILASLPRGVLQRVTIQFPDPWFKKRHYKRRMVKSELVTEIANYLVSGGEVFIQSDVLEVATEMRDRFAAVEGFISQNEGKWLEENPFFIPTEREIATRAKKEPVYRILFVKS